MAYYAGQYGQYPQTAYANQNFQQYNNYPSSAATGSQSALRYSTATTANAQQASSQSYTNPTQQYNYGYSAAASNTATSTTTTQGNTYQQFSSLWYAQNTSTQNQQPQQTQQQTNRSNQQISQNYQQSQMNQYYQQQQQQFQQTYQQGAQQQQYKSATATAPTPAAAAAAAKPVPQTTTQITKPAQQSGGSNQQGDWTNPNQQQQQRGSDYYNNYSAPAKPAVAPSWSGYNQQQGKDWSSQQSQQQVQNKTTYQGGSNAVAAAAAAAAAGGGGDFNYPQTSTIQHPPQIYPAQRNNYQQGAQPFNSFQQGSNPRSNTSDQHSRGFGERGAGHHYGANQENRGNWNPVPPSGQGNWNSGSPGNWSGSGGWGDWNGPRNNPRRGGDQGPHIPPFPQAWQLGGPSQPPLPPGVNRPEPKHNWGAGNNWNQGWDGQNPGRPGGNPARFSRGDGQQQQRNGRYSPNSRSSRGANEKPNRELWSPADSKRTIKDKPVKAKEPVEPEKPIQANEIKAYLYAWLGVRRMRPMYDIHPVGERPDLTFRCELRVGGYKFVGVGEAASKKEAQTDAAWNFAEYLVRQGQLKKADLPIKTKNLEDSNEDFGTVKEYELERERPPQRDIRRHRPPRAMQRGPIPSLMSINTAPMGNIPPFPAFERHPDSWNMPPPPPRRPGGWMEGPPGPWRGGHRGGRGGGGWGRQHENWRQREMEEPWIEEEFQHPEDIFINRMIMNQQEAAMSAKRYEGRPGEWVSLTPARSRNVTTLDDRHVIAKHAAIYPRDGELKCVHEMVTLAERALKGLSDQFVDEDHPIAKDPEEANEEEDMKDGDDKEDEKKDGGEDDDEKAEKKSKIQILKRPKKRPRKVPDTRPRVLCAVNRVGTLAKGLLIHGDLKVCLVLLCGSIPTKNLLNRIVNHLPAKIEAINKSLKYDLTEQESGFVITGHLEHDVTLTVTLTCTSLTDQTKPKKEEDNKETREEKNEEMQDVVEKDGEEKMEKDDDSTTSDCIKITDDDMPDMLPKPLLLTSLAQLRHAKWFQARASQQECGVIITRIIRDLRNRTREWNPLSDWALENLVFVALSSSTEHMSPGDALRRFFEVIAGGVLLEDRTGIVDPCERSEVDVLASCTGQQLEDITKHAQNALLKIAFRRVHEVLDMEKMSMLTNRNQSEFPLVPGEGPQEEDEKEGARKRRLEHNSSDSLAESPKRSLTDEEGDADTQQNLAELSISDQLKGGISIASSGIDNNENSTTNPDVEDEQEKMETDE